MSETLIGVDWESLFVPTVALLEIILRGTLMYLGILVLLRFVLKREAGTVSTSDLLVIVLIAEAASNGMMGESKSVPEGILLIGTIFFWSYVIDWLGYRYPAVEKMLHPPPLPLVKKGKLLRRNMRHEMITLAELESQLREQGIEDVAEVKAAYLEGDGKISVIPFEPKSGGGRRDGDRVV